MASTAMTISLYLSVITFTTVSLRRSCVIQAVHMDVHQFAHMRREHQLVHVDGQEPGEADSLH